MDRQRTKQLNELADRLEHDTANTPPALSDVQQAARELRHLAKLEAEVTNSILEWEGIDRVRDKEIADFQNRVRDLVIELSGAPDYIIDGGGSDGGWQEFTLAEIGQGLSYMADKIAKLESALLTLVLIAIWGAAFALLPTFGLTAL